MEVSNSLHLAIKEMKKLKTKWKHEMCFLICYSDEHKTSSLARVNQHELL